MEISCITSNLLVSNMYLITENKHVIIIDPCENIEQHNPLLYYDWLFLTHEHYDHISGVNVWKELTGAQVLCSQACAENITNPKKNFSHHFRDFALLQTMIDGSNVPESKDYSCTADSSFDEDIDLTWEGHTLKFFSTPGHSDGSSCLLIDNQYLFSGDTLLHQYETALRFPGGSKMKWEAVTVSKLRKLNKEITVYPGHFEEFKFKDWIGNV